ncbi:MAG TPA: nuclear transport factor 2 family protein [Ramlibacter sp.]|nr:nuclear transport factor 2 family protein [Ramlibacter sp.]
MNASTHDAAAVIARDDERIRATLATDMAALQALYAPDLVYVHASGVKDTRESLLANLAAQKTPYRDLRRNDGQVRIYGDVAVLTGAFTAEVIMDGADRSFPASFTSVWVRSGSAWAMASWQATATRKG